MTDDDIEKRDERRAAFFKMLKDGVNDADRALANEALNRAMTGFMKRRGREDSGPYEREDLVRACGEDSSVLLLIVEAEFAIAAARVLERERCARIAEKLDGAQVAAKIRSGE